MLADRLRYDGGMFLLLILLGALGVVPQRPADVVQWSATAASSTVTAGDTAKVVLRAQIQGGWKLYALTQPAGGPQKLSIAIGKDAPFTVTEKQIVAPPAKKMNDPNFGTESQYYEKAVEFTVPIAVAKGASGQVDIPLEVTFQACGADLCLRPFTQKVPVPVTVR
jgi:DsbC/DsbD-like thiol-disulfide interchange protein